MGLSTSEMYDWADKIWDLRDDKGGHVISVFEFYDEAVKDTMRSPYVKLADAPKDYFCKHCKKKTVNVKLWRQYNTFADHIVLLCRQCAEKDQAESIKESEKFWGDRGRPKSDQIGGLVPAVPDFNGNYWGYTSVPADGVFWWKSLPE